MIKLFIPIIPMGAVRTTQKQKFVDKRAQRYHAYKQQIAHLVRQQVKTPSEKPIRAEITFYMPIPNSWSGKKKERMSGAAHTSKPDLDNLVKGAFDSVNSIIWQDDRQVYEVHSRKIYSFNPGITFELWELEEDEGDKAKGGVVEYEARTIDRERLAVIQIFEEGVEKERVKRENPYCKRHGVLFLSAGEYELKGWS